MKKFTTLILFLASSILTAQVTQVLDINTGSGNSSPAELFVFNGALYFYADDSSGTNTGGEDLGKEMWITDGTASGTELFYEFRTGSSNGTIDNFFEFNGKMYFTAWEESVELTSLYESDGTVEGTLYTNNGFSTRNPIVVGSKVYMSNTTNFTSIGTNNALYEYDGTTFQPIPDTGSGFPQISGGHVARLNDTKLIAYMRYLIADDGEDGYIDANNSNYEPFLYDITNQTFTLLKDINPGAENSSISNLTNLGSKVYFEAINKLWVTDGTADGTIEIAAATNASITDVTNFYAWDSKLFFEGDDGTGDQLWMYDPEANTVTNISNISGTNNDHDPSDYAVYDGYLYYRGEDADDTNGHLFRTNGTTIAQLDATIKDIDEITVFNDKLYFEGDDGVTGNELYTLNPNTLSIDPIFEQSISIYPNPSNTFINVKGDFSETINYTIYDIRGRSVRKGQVVNELINHNLSSGMYIIKLISANKIASRKLIVR